MHFLGKGDGHEGIAQVYDKLCQCHFHERSAAQNQVQTGKLSGRGEVGHGDQHGNHNRQLSGGCHNAEGERDRKIAESNRNAVRKSGFERVTYLYIGSHDVYALDF